MSNRKFTRQELNEKLNAASDRFVEKYSHAYAHGVFYTSLVNVLVDLPLHKQREILNVLNSLALKED